jgi:hypothetical protein
MRKDLRVGFVDCAVLAVVERLVETKLATLESKRQRVRFWVSPSARASDLSALVYVSIRV